MQDEPCQEKGDEGDLPVLRTPPDHKECHGEHGRHEHGVETGKPGLSAAKVYAGYEDGQPVTDPESALGDQRDGDEGSPEDDAEDFLQRGHGMRHKEYEQSGRTGECQQEKRYPAALQITDGSCG